MTCRIKEGWLKWQSAFAILCYRRLPMRLRRKSYKAVIRPTLLYGLECRALKKRV